MSASDHSTLSFLDPGPPPSAPRAESPLPVSRSCPGAALSPVPPSPAGLSALCLPVSPPASPSVPGAAGAAASPLAPAADVPRTRCSLSAGAEQAELAPPAALSPVSACPPTAALLASRYLRAPRTPGGGGGTLMDSFGLSLTLDGGAIEETVSEDVRLLSSVRTAEVGDARCESSRAIG